MNHDRDNAERMTMAENKIRQIRTFRHAWVVFFVLSVLLMLSSLSYLIFGISIEPQANATVNQISLISPHLGNFVREILRVFGLSWFTWGFLSAAISITAYRRNEIWAWYAFWILPVYAIGDGLIDYMAGGNKGWIIWIGAGISIIMLLLSPQRLSIFRKNDAS